MISVNQPAQGLAAQNVQRHRHRLTARYRVRPGRSPANRVHRGRSGQRHHRPPPRPWCCLPIRQGLPVRIRRFADLARDCHRRELLRPDRRRAERYPALARTAQRGARRATRRIHRLVQRAPGCTAPSATAAPPNLRQQPGGEMRKHYWSSGTRPGTGGFPQWSLTPVQGTNSYTTVRYWVMLQLVKRIFSHQHESRLTYYRARLRVALPLPSTRNLDLAARIYGTDKSSRYHGYTEQYLDHLASRRRHVRSVLEIGIGGITSRTGFDTLAGGQSLKMWRSFFPRAQIVGIDIKEKAVKGRRISTECGSQNDPKFLSGIAQKYGPFDLVIDDGSHIASHVRTSFETLFEHVRTGGIYVIEHLEHAYSPERGGGPPGSHGGHMALLKSLLDDVLRRHWDHQGTARHVASVHVYDEIAFIYKEDYRKLNSKK